MAGITLIALLLFAASAWLYATAVSSAFCEAREQDKWGEK